MTISQDDQTTQRAEIFPMPEQLLANAKQRSKNRTTWRQDLRKPTRHDDHTSTHLHCRDYSSPDATPVELWSVVGRGLQLVADQQMVDPNHPNLAGSEAIGWAWPDPTLLDRDPDAYPYRATPIADINLSTFTTISDVIRALYGISKEETEAINRAEDNGTAPDELAKLIRR